MKTMTAIKKIMPIFSLLCCYIIFNIAYANIIIGNSVVADDDISKVLLKKIANNNMTSTVKGVTVTVNNGVVTLEGKVNSNDIASEFIALSASVVGVFDVDTTNFLLYRGKKLPPDPFAIELILTAKVKGAIVRGKAFGDIDVNSIPITITTNNGIVYLKGMVDSTAQMIYTIKLAQAVPGVPRVISELSVKASPVYMPN